MSQKPEPGPNRWIVLMSLCMGVGVLLLIFVLNTKDADEGPSSGAANLSDAATRLSLLKSNAPEIRKWIRDKMAADHARVGVVNIWATWCEPCRDEMPELAKYQKLKQAPLFLVSADNETDETVVRSFLADKGVDFESSLVRGDQQEFVESWQALSSKDPAHRWSMTLPATFLIDASGEVISFAVGTTTAADLAALVKKSLDTAHD